MTDETPPPNYTGLWMICRDYGARIETEYVNGVPNGIFRYWHEGGACLREGFKINGLWHGKLITRSTDGSVLDVSDFDEGTGVYRIFNSNNQMTDEVPMLRGTIHGVIRCWRLGKLITTSFFDNGVCNAVTCEA